MALELIHVPYKGSSPVLADLVGGRIDFLFDPITTSLPFVKDGKLRALGVTGDRRSPLAPDVPTLRELGYTGYDVNPWFGLSAPAGTPRPIVDRINAEYLRALKHPDILRAAGRARHRADGQHARGLREAHRHRDGALDRGRGRLRRQGGLTDRTRSRRRG